MWGSDGARDDNPGKWVATELEKTTLVSGVAKELETTKKALESGVETELETTAKALESGVETELETTKKALERGVEKELETTEKALASGVETELEITQTALKSGVETELEKTTKATTLWASSRLIPARQGHTRSIFTRYTRTATRIMGKGSVRRVRNAAEGIVQYTLERG